MPHPKHIQYSIHGAEKRVAEGFGRREVYHALTNGTVVEKYPDTGRGKSYLLNARLPNGRPIHIVGADKPASRNRSAHTVIVTRVVPYMSPSKLIESTNRKTFISKPSLSGGVDGSGQLLFDV